MNQPTFLQKKINEPSFRRIASVAFVLVIGEVRHGKSIQATVKNGGGIMLFDKEFEIVKKL